MVRRYILIGLLLGVGCTLLGRCYVCDSSYANNQNRDTSQIPASKVDQYVNYIITRAGIYEYFAKGLRQVGFLEGRNTKILPNVQSYLFLNRDDLKNITYLIPHDRAFADLPDYLRRQIFSDTRILRDVLLYHMVKGRHYHQDFESGPLETLLGKVLHVQRADNNSVVINGKAMITAKDIKMQDGVVHTLNAVLLP